MKIFLRSFRYRPDTVFFVLFSVRITIKDILSVWIFFIPNMTKILSDHRMTESLDQISISLVVELPWANYLTLQQPQFLPLSNRDIHLASSQGCKDT